MCILHICIDLSRLEGPLVSRHPIHHREHRLDVRSPTAALREYLSIEHKYAVHLSPSWVIFRDRWWQEAQWIFACAGMTTERGGRIASALWDEGSPRGAIDMSIRITSKGA